MAERVEYLTVPEVMALLRLGRTTVYAHARLFLATDGAEGIPCRRFGRSLRFPSDELARYTRPKPSDRPAPTAGAAAGPTPTPPRPARATRGSTRTGPSRRTEPTRTMTAAEDDTAVQAALPFTD